MPGMPLGEKKSSWSGYRETDSACYAASSPSWVRSIIAKLRAPRNELSTPSVAALNSRKLLTRQT